MKTLTSPEHFTFTNHFNQSLLKSRIAMMNKRKSNWKAFGKYGLFIASIWVSAAFTKPYRAKVAAQIVEKVPELEAVLTPKTKHETIFNDFIFEAPVRSSLDSTSFSDIQNPVVTNTDTQKYISATKYIIYKNDALYWLITPKTTMEDLVDMKKEFVKHNQTFEVSGFQLDPLNSFIISVEAKGNGCGYKSFIPDNYDKPVSSHGGYVSLTKKSCGTLDSQKMPDELKVLAQKDDQLAQVLRQKNRISYLEIKTSDSLGPGGSTSITKETLLKLAKPTPQNSLVKQSNYLNLTENDFLSIAKPRRNDIILLNGNPSTLEEVEKIHIKDFYSAIFKETWQENKLLRQHYILIFTEPLNP